MKTLFLDAHYAGEVRLCQETLGYLKDKRYKTIGLYASVQFVNKLDDVKKQLQENSITIVTSKPDRSHAEGQLLGCHVYKNSLNLSEEELAEIDCYLYVGDGRFHPLALLYGQKDKEKDRIKEIVCNDPIQKKMSIISINEIMTILKKQKATLIKFLSAKSTGVIVTTKSGQEQLKPSLELEKKFPDKKFYYFIDDTVSFDQLENFPFIDIWVNTACPRIGLDEQEKFRKGVINLNDAFVAAEILKKEMG